MPRAYMDFSASYENPFCTRRPNSGISLAQWLARSYPPDRPQPILVMNLRPKTRFVRALTGAFASFVGASSIFAQVLLMPVPSGPSPLAVARDLSSGTKRAAPASSLESALASGRPLFKTRNLVYSGNFSYRYADGTRLRTDTGNDRDTAIQTLAFSGDLSIGRHWSLSHSTTKSYYENDEFRDPLDYSAKLAAGYAVGEWKIAASFSYSISNDTLLEIGAQTKRESFDTSLSFARQIGERTSFDVSVTYSRGVATAVDYSLGVTTDFVPGRSIIATESVSYEASKKLRFGVGLSQGFYFLSVGPDAYSVRPTAHASWKPTGRISLAADAGYEYRRFDTGGNNRLLENPVYSLSLIYRPAETTSLSVSANASQGSSFFVNRSTRTTGWRASLGQRLLGRFFFSASYLQGKTDYVAVDRGLDTDRRDKNKGYNISLSTAFSQRASLSLGYDEVDNTSDTTRFTLSSHQYSITLGYRF